MSFVLVIKEKSKHYYVSKAEIGFQDSATNVTVPGTNLYTESASEIVVPFEID